MDTTKANLVENENLRIWLAVLREKYGRIESKLDRNNQNEVRWPTPHLPQDGQLSNL